MNLIVDKGNTKTKIAVFNKTAEIVFIKVFANDKFDTPKSIIKKYEIKNCIICNVSKEQVNIEKNLFNTFIEFSDKTPTPIINKYQTPETLGLDRLALSVAANEKFPQQDCLIIDAGTCITYDIVTKEKEYLGGAISPGINMRFKALHQQTGKLPLVNYNETDFPTLIGRKTNDALYSGVVNAVLFEMKGFIAAYRKMFPPLNIILTGGDKELFEMALKNHIFADQNLILKGLNKILNYNVENNK